MQCHEPKARNALFGLRPWQSFNSGDVQDGNLLHEIFRRFGGFCSDADEYRRTEYPRKLRVGNLVDGTIRQKQSEGFERFGLEIFANLARRNHGGKIPASRRRRNCFPLAYRLLQGDFSEMKLRDTNGLQKIDFSLLSGPRLVVRH